MDDKTLAERFAAFDRANPHVYDTLACLARQAKQAGRSRLGMKMLWEVMRWELVIQTCSNDAYQLNNNYTALYARKLMKHEPELAGIFETRSRRAR